MEQVKYEKVFIGSDHAGYDMKELLKKHLQDQNLTVEDVGTYSSDRCDYPDYAVKLSEGLLKAGTDKNIGVVVCGSGIGVSIAANKVKGVRCGLCHDEYTAKKSRSEDHCNIVALGGRVVGPELAKKIVDTFLTTKPSEQDESYKKRMEKIAQIEEDNLRN